MNGQPYPPVARATKTPTHTLTRVRNNQRRHRQRRREYIEYLEQRLNDAEKSLAHVQAENAALRRNITWVTPPGQGTSDHPSPAITETNGTTQFTSAATYATRKIRHCSPTARVAGPGSASIASAAELQRDFLPQQVGNEPYETTLIDNLLPFPLSPKLPISLHAEVTLPATYLPSSSTVQPSSACCSRTSPGLSLFDKDTDWPNDQTSVSGASMVLAMSSTTQCSQAYLTIQLHNRRQLPMELVERWLSPGFIDCGPAAEQGCRVDNLLLLGLLEYITEGESLRP